MKPVVLDSSAILVALNAEPGHEKLTPAIMSASISSTVNLAEVHSKLVAGGMDPKDAWEATRSSVSSSVEFTMLHAEMTGGLIAQTRALGLSLGDRACLALGVALGAAVYTADRAWKQLKLPVRIHIIR
jgi:PIN domain nuclease of toxin-antitoxin system